jgi:hypothetical protein
MSLRSSALCLSFLLTVSCRDVKDLLALGAALKHQYPDSQVSVSLTDGLILTVTVADSGFAVASCEGQAAVAMRIASFVRGNYAGFDGLRTISIAFASSRSQVRTTASAAGLPFRFGRTLLGAGLTQADSTRAVESCKAWRELR